MKLIRRHGPGCGAWRFVKGRLVVQVVRTPFARSHLAAFRFPEEVLQIIKFPDIFRSGGSNRDSAQWKSLIYWTEENGHAPKKTYPIYPICSYGPSARSYSSASDEPRFRRPFTRQQWDIFYEIHEYGGLAAFVFVFLFWVILTARRVGTAPGLLFPWFSQARMTELLKDIRLHLQSLIRLRLPVFDKHGALSSAVHGLGLLLMTVMATTGTVYYFINNGDPDAGRIVGVLMLIHTTLADFVWAYLIGHAALAVIHHVTDNLSLSEMWSLRGNATVEQEAQGH